MSHPRAPFKTVTVSPRAAARLRGGHPWVYRSDLEFTDEPAPGEAVLAMAGGPRRGENPELGSGFYSSTSQIALRMATRAREPLDAAFIEKRLREALSRRQRAFGDEMPEAYRWVHGESDGLPGLVVDRFKDAVSVQVLCQGTDALQDAILGALDAVARPSTVVLRNDVPSRQKEGLPLEKKLVRGAPAVRFHEGRAALEIDLMEGQKTGTFLDQRDNHVLAGRLARGRALDCFSGDGGFALQMAGHAQSVLAVDSSDAAVQRIRANARANGLGNVEGRTANAFDFLREQAAAGEMYDTIVVDPPGFAKGRGNVDGALRGYKELNLRALRMLKPGGVLVTCSCSQPITMDMFTALLVDAARDARRQVQVLGRHGPGPDHPVMLGFPESDYLKCVVLAVLP